MTALDTAYLVVLSDKIPVCLLVLKQESFQKRPLAAGCAGKGWILLEVGRRPLSTSCGPRQHLTALARRGPGTVEKRAYVFTMGYVSSWVKQITFRILFTL